MKQVYLLSSRTAMVIAILSAPAVSHALVLSNPANSLTGALGTVEVASLADAPTLGGYLDSGGIVDPAPATPVQRVQYDVLNQAGNGSIFEYRVTFPAGTNVIAAGNPSEFIDGAGAVQSYWAGSNYAMLFDSGYGTYNYDLALGSEWRIVYDPTYVEWQHVGNGFFPNTATGRTDLGTAIPTFTLMFDPATPLGLQPAQVTGRSVSGAPVAATGFVLSAVPEPVSAALAVVGLALMATWRRARLS